MYNLRLKGVIRMPTIKKLTHLGNSQAVILDKVLLQQLNIEPESEVEITLEDQAITIRLHRYASDQRAMEAGRRVMKRRSKAMKDLAKR